MDREKMKADRFDIALSDDGTMDTVFRVYDRVTGERRYYSYSQEFAADWRDESGVLDEINFVQDVVEIDAEFDFEV